MPKNKEYDAIIIGAGIGGLVCGCYLAKSGMKVLIVEKNSKPGGYCTSFKKNGFLFDVCGHSIGSMRHKGNIDTIFKELNITSKHLKFMRYDPHDIVLFGNKSVCFCNNINKTISGFQLLFPKESKRIKEFFTFVNNCKGISFNSLRNITFNKFLDKYFNDSDLKSILYVLVLGNTGTSPFSISAFTAITIFKEFTFDGGYYPIKGGVEELPKLFMKIFKKFGGEIVFSQEAQKIVTDEMTIQGVQISSKFIRSKYVISNADCLYTFTKLLEKCGLPNKFLSKLKSLKPTKSMFILYLGLSKSFQCELLPGTTNWLINSNFVYKESRKYHNKESEIDWCAIKIYNNRRKNIVAFTTAPFNSKEYWRINCKKWGEELIKHIQYAIPNLSKFIKCQYVATPYDLFESTLNYKGARCGWEGTPNQIMIPEISNTTVIKNLFLSGHWTTQSVGIPGVAYRGKETAKIILLKEKKMLKTKKNSVKGKCL